MSPLVVLVVVLAPAAIFELVNRVAPHLIARLAFAPFHRRVSIALPPRAAALLVPPQEGGETYRELPARHVSLAALPGEARVERDGQVVRFVPELGYILAHPLGSASGLLRVDVSGDAGAWLLRARRFPAAELVWVTIVLAAAARWHAPRYRGAWIFIAVVAGAYSVGIAWHKANRSFDAVVAEVKARIGLANGDPPPAPSPPAATASRFTGPDEWTCACGKLNERKHAMCRRCWAQRPAG